MVVNIKQAGRVYIIGKCGEHYINQLRFDISDLLEACEYDCAVELLHIYEINLTGRPEKLSATLWHNLLIYNIEDRIKDTSGYHYFAIRCKNDRKKVQSPIYKCAVL